MGYVADFRKSYCVMVIF